MKNRVTSDNFPNWDYIFIKRISDPCSWKYVISEPKHRYNVIGIPCFVKSSYKITRYHFKEYHSKKMDWFENEDIEQCRGYNTYKELLESEFENML